MLNIITSKKNNALETAKKWPVKRPEIWHTRACYNVHNCKSMWDTGACVSVSCNTTGQDKITVLLVFNSVRSHWTELKELSITNVSRCKHRYSTISLQDTSQYLALFNLWSAFYYINTNEIPGDFSCENMISSHVKITCYFHMWKYHRCYGYVINLAFHRKRRFQWNGLVFHWCLYNK